MTESIKNQYAPDVVSPPGETLAEILSEKGMSQTELAQRLDRPLKTVNEIIKGKAAITPETSQQLQLVLGIPASFWDQREMNYRSYLAKKKAAKMLARHRGWLTDIPYREMVKLGWVPESKSVEERMLSVLGFFGTATPRKWETYLAPQKVAFRKTLPVTKKIPGLASWLRQGEIEGGKIPTERYKKGEFRAALSKCRELITEKPEVFQKVMIQLCARAGVAVTFVPAITGLGVYGATKWLSSNKALIQLSLLRKTDDQLWFSFFHEAAHILFHSKKRKTFLEERHPDGSVREEREANEFSGNILIPQNEYERIASGVINSSSLRSHAKRLKVSPGVLVGRLQHDKIIGYHQLNSLKMTFAWI